MADKLPPDYLHVIGHPGERDNSGHVWVSIVNTRGRQILAVVDHWNFSIHQMMVIGQACAEVINQYPRTDLYSAAPTPQSRPDPDVAKESGSGS